MGYSGAIAISAIGMHSSLGGLLDSAAAFRAGISRLREMPDWPYFDDDTLHETHLIGCPASGLSDGFQGIARLAKLAAYAAGDLNEFMNPSEIKGRSIRAFLATGGLEANSEAHDIHVKAIDVILQQCRSVLNKEIQIEPSARIFGGELGAIQALEAAIQCLRNGEAECSLVGSFDTLLDPNVLGNLLRAGVVKTVDNACGLVPGEAGCIVLLERLSDVTRRGAKPWGVISGLSYLQHSEGERPSQSTESYESPCENPPTGEWLAQVIGAALEQAAVSTATGGTLYSNLNGMEFQASDFGCALVRMANSYSLASWKHEIPDLSFGDTGIAFSGLAVGLAIRGFMRGYAVGNTALICMGSHGSDRGAIVVRNS